MIKDKKSLWQSVKKSRTPLGSRVLFFVDVTDISSPQNYKLKLRIVIEQK